MPEPAQPKVPASVRRHIIPVGCRVKSTPVLGGLHHECGLEKEPHDLGSIFVDHCLRHHPPAEPEESHSYIFIYSRFPGILGMATSA